MHGARDRHTTHAKIRSVGQHEREHSKSSKVVGVGRRRGKHTRTLSHKYTHGHTPAFVCVEIDRSSAVRGQGRVKRQAGSAAAATASKLFLAFKRAFEEQGRQSYGAGKQSEQKLSAESAPHTPKQLCLFERKRHLTESKCN